MSKNESIVAPIAEKIRKFTQRLYLLIRVDFADQLVIDRHVLMT